MASKTDKYRKLTASAEQVKIPAKLAQEFLTSPVEQTPQTDEGYISRVWTPDNMNGTYTNPVIYADYSDPDVIRVKNDYYMTSSSFSCLPGLPILHSKDLVNWTLIGYALAKYPNDLFEKPQHGKGVWAPSFRYHKKQFYIYWGDPDAGIYMVRSSSPTGPWEEPVLVLPGLGLIDPCPLWDDDGKAYLVQAWAASRVGVNSLLTVHPMNPEGTKVIGQGKHVYDGNEHNPTIEGPKFYKRNNYYYILAPAGGVKTGWQLALRSKDIYGPYETKIVLEQGSTAINGPHQGGLIETPSGQSWFIHFQDRGAYGRLVHLQPAQWQDGWPVMGRYNQSNSKYEPVMMFQKPDIKGEFPVVNPYESDEFNTDQLGLQWQWQANPKLTWFGLLRDTPHLRLYAEEIPNGSANLWGAGNLLLQKLPAPTFTVTTKVTFNPKGSGKQAGLIVMGQDYACLTIKPDQNGLQLAQVVCKNAAENGTETIIEETAITSETVYLKVRITDPDATCRFSFSLEGKTFQELGEPFTAKPGKWIGAKVGLFCTRQHGASTGGYADFDWFRIEP